MTRILLADDHQIVRQGLRVLLESRHGFEIVGEAGNGFETLELAEKLRPELLILDLLMPGLSGVDVVRRMKSQESLKDIRVVMLTMQSGEGYVIEAFKAGADAYVLKEAGAAELLQGIQAALKGETYLSPPLTMEKLKEYEAKARGGAQGPYATLTPREREVFKLIAEGNSNSEVAFLLHISPRTVEVHRANLMGKLGVRNQADLVRMAVEQGLITVKMPPAQS